MTTSIGFTFNSESTLILDTIGNPFAITIGYAGKEVIQNVVVAEIASISILTHATKLNYNSGDAFDPAGMVITINYSDGETSIVTYNATTSADFSFSPSTPLTRTGNVITVTYDGKTADEILNVTELTGVTIETYPSKYTYVTGQTLNPNGLILTLSYIDSNNVVTNVPVTYNSTTQNKFVFNPSGVVTTSGNVTITYDGITTAGMQPTFPIAVKSIASISVANSPITTSYTVGSKLNPAGIRVQVYYQDGTNEIISYNANIANDFTFNPSLSASLIISNRSVTVTYAGKSSSFAISVTQSSGGYVPSGSRGSTGGGGGGGGFQNATPVKYIDSNFVEKERINDANASWNYNKLTGYWELSLKNSNGNIKYGFFTITSIIKETVNGVEIEKTIYRTYYFDSNGYMFFGWLHTLDNNWYFFDTDLSNLGTMIVSSWKKIDGKWYYFDKDGKLLVNMITPDGYQVDENGVWVE